jgi:hypothetical protein
VGLVAAAVLAAAAIISLRSGPTARIPEPEVSRVTPPAAAVTNIPKTATTIPKIAKARSRESRPLPQPAPDRLPGAAIGLDPADPDALSAALNEMSRTGEFHTAQGSRSPVEMRIATSDPNVVIIWLQATTGGSDE